MDQVLTKCDLLTDEEVDNVLNFEGGATQLWNREQDRNSILPHHDYCDDVGSDRVVNQQRQSLRQGEDGEELQQKNSSQQQFLERRRRNRHRLTSSICQLLDDYSMISFIPLNIRDEDSIDTVLACVDASIQYGEDLEVRDYVGDGESTDE